MIVIDHPHDLSADDEAELVAYVDGNLDAEGRSRVEARAASDPSFAAAVAQQRQGRAVDRAPFLPAVPSMSETVTATTPASGGVCSDRPECRPMCWPSSRGILSRR